MTEYRNANGKCDVEGCLVAHLEKVPDEPEADAPETEEVVEKGHAAKLIAAVGSAIQLFIFRKEEASAITFVNYFMGIALVGGAFGWVGIANYMLAWMFVADAIRGVREWSTHSKWRRAGTVGIMLVAALNLWYLGSRLHDIAAGWALC